MKSFFFSVIVYAATFACQVEGIVLERRTTQVKAKETGPRIDDAARQEYERFVAKLIKRLMAEELTMQNEKLLIGLKRQIERIVDLDIGGDVYETGSWRGGTSIFMAAVMDAYEKLTGKQPSTPRTFWVWDSFEGFPVIEGDPALKQYLANGKSHYAAPLDSVRESFRTHGITDSRFDVRFVKGYFEDTVPKHKNSHPIAILRMDGDLYSSTKVVLDGLYSHVSSGGVVIIDDYDWGLPQFSSTTKLCKAAVDEFLRSNGLTERFVRPSGERPYWIKP